MKINVLYVVVALLSAISGYSQHISSQLFTSTVYDSSRLRNFTNAGYRSGTKPIPNYPVKVNVLSYGATPNDTTGDQQAFRLAIIACGDSGTIYIPAGEYYIKDSIQIRKKRIVLRGAGQGKTILRFPKGLRELYPIDTAVTANYFSWSFALITFQGSNPNHNNSGLAIEDAGIENLTIAFPDNAWVGHDFYERGYNAIGFDRFANNCWVRNVNIIGCDMGVWVSRLCNNITIQNIEFSADSIRNKSIPVGLNYDSGRIGHHGINIYGKYNLIQDFNFKGKFAHDLSVESDSAKFNVFRRGYGVDMNIDHHHHGQRFNLFTNLDMGEGKRPFKSSGATEPQGISVAETYWCLKAARNMNYFTQYDNNVDTAKSRNNVAVGVRTSTASSLPDSKNNWLENINPTLLTPQDLYSAQLSHYKKAKYYEWPVFATRSNSNSTPSNAIDGNWQTVWSASGNGDYLSFSLADTTSVNAIKIAFDSADVRQYRFSVLSSVDGISWSSALTNTQSSGSATGFELFKFGNRLAKYIKIIGLGCTNNSNITQSIDTNLIAIKEVVAVYQTTPLADAFVRDGTNASRNFGKDSILTVKNDVVNFKREAYLQFDMSNVKPVIAACNLSLKLRYANTNINTAKWLVAFVKSDNWVDTTINWNSTLSFENSTLYSDTINGISAIGSFVDWNVTNIVNAEALNNEAKVSFKLVNLVANAQGDANFHSKEATTNNRPILTVEYKTEFANDSAGTNANLPTAQVVGNVTQATIVRANKIYPNPIGSEMNVVLNGGDREVIVYNVFGKPIYSNKMNGQKSLTIKTAPWSTGLYLVTILNQNGTRTNTRVVK